MGSREEKYKEILRAAIRVFSKYGFERAKMEYIAKEAGIGKGTIYEYVESKERLFVEILQYSIEEFSQGLKMKMEQGKAIAEKLAKGSLYYAEFLSGHIDIVHVATQVKFLSEEMRSNHLSMQKDIQDYFMEMIRIAQKKGELRADLDEELAYCCIMGSMMQFSMQHALCNSNHRDEVEHHAMVEVLMRGLR